MSIIREAQAHLEGVTLSRKEEKTFESMKRKEAKDLYTQGWTAANGNLNSTLKLLIHNNLLKNKTTPLQESLSNNLR